MVGETLDWGVETLAGSVGAHILAIFLFVAAVLLLTGASVAGVIKFASDSVSVDDARGADRGVDAAPAPDRGAGDAGALHARAREGAADRRGRGAAGVRQRLGRRAGGREPRRGSRGWPRIPPEDEPGVTRGPSEPVEPEQLTPQGRYRPEVTDSPDFVWELPDPAMLTRSSEDASRPDTAGQEKVAAQLLEALGHFNIEARVIGMVAGPHITRYELRLAPGIKVGKVAQLKDDLAYALAAADIRILAPIPGKQAVGIEVPERAPADRAPGRRLPGAAARLVAADGVARQGRRRAARSAPTWRRCRTCWSRARPAPASRARSTRCCPRSCCARRRTRCGWCSSTPSRSSSRTTTRSRTC